MRYRLLLLVLALCGFPAIAQDAAGEDEPTETEEIAAEQRIEEIERGVRGGEPVEEFVPKDPLSADKAIALPSDI